MKQSQRKKYLKLTKSCWCQWWKQAGGLSHPSLLGRCPHLQFRTRVLRSPALQYLSDSLPVVLPFTEFCKSWPHTSMDSTEIWMYVEIRVLSSCLLYSDFCTDINQAPAACKKESISLKKAASPWQPSIKLFCFTNISPISPRMKWFSKINLQQAQHITHQGQIQVPMTEKCTVFLLSPESLLWNSGKQPATHSRSQPIWSYLLVQLKLDLQQLRTTASFLSRLQSEVSE